MAQTSIHFQAVKGGSEEHNKRTKKLDYVHHKRSSMNDYWQSDSQEARLAFVTANAKAKTGRKMQAKATPIREAVVVIEDTTTMDDLKKLAKRFNDRFGIDVFQIAIHKDEGYHKGKDGLKLNLHAHMVADWTDHQSGKSLKLNRNDMAEMQTICAEVLGMERGVSSDKKHLTAMQYKEQKAKEEAERAEAEKQWLSRAITVLIDERNKTRQETEKILVKKKEVEKAAAKSLVVEGAKKLTNVLGLGNEAKALRQVPSLLATAKEEGRAEAVAEVCQGARIKYSDPSKVTPTKVGADLAKAVTDARERAKAELIQTKKEIAKLKNWNEAYERKQNLFLSLPIIEAVLEALRRFVSCFSDKFPVEDEEILSQALQGDESKAHTLMELGYSFGGVFSQPQYSYRWREAERLMVNIANGVDEEEKKDEEISRSWRR